MKVVLSPEEQQIYDTYISEDNSDHVIVSRRDLSDLLKKYNFIMNNPDKLIHFNASSETSYLDNAQTWISSLLTENARHIYAGLNAAAYLKLNAMWKSPDISRSKSINGYRLDGSIYGIDIYKYPSYRVSIKPSQRKMLSNMVFITDKNDNIIKAVLLEGLREYL